MLALMVARSPQKNKTEQLVMKELGVASSDSQKPEFGHATTKDNQIYAQIQQLIGRCSEVGLSAVLMMVDIDHFKALNDSCGHVFGDEVIRGVASCMARSLDQDGDFVARYGGEEFAIVISGRLSDGIQRGEALLEQIRSLQFFREGEGHSVTVSVGVSAIRMGEDASSWIDRSDRALYLSKQMGRNRLTAES